MRLRELPRTRQKCACLTIESVGTRRSDRVSRHTPRWSRLSIHTEVIKSLDTHRGDQVSRYTPKWSSLCDTHRGDQVSLDTHRGDRVSRYPPRWDQVLSGHTEVIKSLGTHQKVIKPGHNQKKKKTIGVSTDTLCGGFKIWRANATRRSTQEHTEQCLKHEVTRRCQPLLAAGQDTSC